MNEINHISDLLKHDFDDDENYTFLFQEDLSLPENFLNIFKRLIWLPQDFYKIFCAYAFCPSAVSRKVPYLFCYGASGSGKSTAIKLIAALHGVPVFSANTTAVAIRNEISRLRKTLIEIPPEEDQGVPTYHEKESNFLLPWDDIDPQQLKPGKEVYRLFKNGNDRKTDTILISGEERGSTIRFRCFSLKAVSSIHPFHKLSDYSELARRLIVIPFEKLDKTKLKEIKLKKFVDFDSFNWDGLNNDFNEFWDIDKAKYFLSKRKELSRSKFPFSSDKKGLLLDIISSGLVCGYWSSKQEAIEDFTNYYNWLDSDFKKDTFTLQGALAKLAEIEINNANQAGILPVINPKDIKRLLDSAYKDGILIDKPSNREVYSIMKNLGWEQKNKLWVFNK